MLPPEISAQLWLSITSSTTKENPRNIREIPEENKWLIG